MTEILTNLSSILAGFTSPVDIPTTPAGLLLALPLIAVIAIVYKAVKLEDCSAKEFVKQSALLFGSITIFMVLSAIAIFIVIKIFVG